MESLLIALVLLLSVISLSLIRIVRFVCKAPYVGEFYISKDGEDYYMMLNRELSELAKCKRATVKVKELDLSKYKDAK